MVASLIVALALTAGEGPGKPNPHLDVAVEQIRGFQELEALQTLEQSKRWAWNSPRDLALTNLYIGWAHAELGRENEALEAFRLARLLDPTVPFPNDVSPRLEALWVKSGGALPPGDRRPQTEAAVPNAATSAPVTETPGSSAGPIVSTAPADAEPLRPQHETDATQPTAVTEALRTGASPGEEVTKQAWPRWVATGAMAIGVAAAVGGVVAGSASRTHLTRSAAEPRVDRAQALHARAASDAQLANILFGVGAAAGAGGAVTFLLAF